MLRTMDVLRWKLASLRGTRFVLSLLLLAVFGCLFLLPTAGFAAPDSPQVEQLKQKAQNAFVKGDYAAAAVFDLEIAEKHPGTEARRYAVQILGTIYEEKVVDLKKAIKWDREFLEKYADYRQAPFYKEKLASLEKLMSQEQAYKAYQAIQIGQLSDEVLVKKLEALLKEHPDFLLRDQVESELGHAYARMDERKKSALAFQAVAAQGTEKLSSTDQGEYKSENRYWQMRTTWAYVAFAVIGILWAVVLWMNPWKQLTWPSIRTFLSWPALWLVVTGASMPFFYSMETKGYPIQIPALTVYSAIGLNLLVLFWLMLLVKGRFCQTSPRARRWLSPVLAVLMTTGVFYLWVVYQPNGPYIVDKCVVKWKVEFREHVTERLAKGQLAGTQGSRSAELAPTTPNNPEGSK